jgi:hypothetical protein
VVECLTDTHKALGLIRNTAFKNRSLNSQIFQGYGEDDVGEVEIALLQTDTRGQTVFLKTWFSDLKENGLPATILRPEGQIKGRVG